MEVRLVKFSDENIGDVRINPSAVVSVTDGGSGWTMIKMITGNTFRVNGDIGIVTRELLGVF